MVSVWPEEVRRMEQGSRSIVNRGRNEPVIHQDN